MIDVVITPECEEVGHRHDVGKEVPAGGQRVGREHEPEGSGHEEEKGCAEVFSGQEEGWGLLRRGPGARSWGRACR